MLEIFSGIISGILSGTGMGGGTLLILILSAFIGIDQHISQGANLVFFIPTSIAAIIANTREKLINWKVGVPVTIFGIVGAILGSKVATILEVKILKKCFGIFLIIIAMHEIYALVDNKKKGE